MHVCILHVGRPSEVALERQRRNRDERADELLAGNDGRRGDDELADACWLVDWPCEQRVRHERFATIHDGVPFFFCFESHRNAAISARVTPPMKNTMVGRSGRMSDAAVVSGGGCVGEAVLLLLPLTMPTRCIGLSGFTMRFSVLTVELAARDTTGAEALWLT